MRINYKGKYFKWGLTAFIAVCGAVIFYFILERIGIVSESLFSFFSIVRPFIYGLVIAYLLCPVYNSSMKLVNYIVVEKLKFRHSMTLFKVISTLLTLLFATIVIGGLIVLVIPQVMESATKLAKSAPESFNNMVLWIQNQILENKNVNSVSKIIIGDYAQNLHKWLEDMAMPRVLEMASTVSDGLFGIVNVLADLFIGIIVCIYFLNSKDNFRTESKKMIYAFFETEKARKLIKEFSFINGTFGSFINGKLIDSAIIGVLCFIAMTFMNMPYAVLVSVIVGVTNIIPFFGPFIGAVPSVIIILTEDPWKAFYFLILIFVLQQLDGNVIGPKILGDSTGLPEFWVLFAILLGGGLFGFVGMIVGIPIFAVFYSYIKRFINYKLEKRSMPVSSFYYTEGKIPLKIEKGNND